MRRLVNLADDSERVLVPGEQLIVGRSATVSDWVICQRLPQQRARRLRGTRARDGLSVNVVDRGSSNGTKVGSAKLSAQTPQVLRDDEIIALGSGVRIQLELIG